jgi:D-aminopeptidase
VITIDDHEYTIGVLVQSNFGATEDFLLNGQPAGQKILKWKQEEKEDHNPMVFSESDKGSIMTILATDLPVSHRQLKRIIRRTAVGIARTGGYTGHGSGEVMIGFTTANRIPPMSEGKLLTQTVIHENCINQAFQAAAEATNEAILNSMVCAESTRGIEGEIYSSLAEYLPALLAES